MFSLPCGFLHSRAIFWDIPWAVVWSRRTQSTAISSSAWTPCHGAVYCILTNDTYVRIIQFNFPILLDFSPLFAFCGCQICSTLWNVEPQHTAVWRSPWQYPLTHVTSIFYKYVHFYSIFNHLLCIPNILRDLTCISVTVVLNWNVYLPIL